ncbi:MAG: hypothetical protein ACI8RD_013918 [Bacillariaceae sp.]|jgi:hypothetical protein
MTGSSNKDNNNAHHLGIGAIVSFQVKFIHPHKNRDVKFPYPVAGQRITGCRVVRRALKKIKHKPTICAVVHHDDFKDEENGEYYEIWCNESHIRVDKEGDSTMFFEGHHTERERGIVTNNGNGHDNGDKQDADEDVEQQLTDEEEDGSGSLKKENVLDDDIDEEKRKDNEEPLATVREVFSFAKSWKTKRNLAIGLFASALSGAIQPAIAIAFSQSFVNFADSANENGVRNLAFTFMYIGAYAFFAMMLQSAFLETAAAEMTDNMKQDWFDSLLRQDIAYYDVMDTSGTATILTVNGKKFKR